MTINVNLHVTPFEPAAGAADTSLSLNEALRLKKKKCRHLDLLEMLVSPHLPQSAPQLDAAIARAAVSQEQSLDLSTTVNTEGESPQTSRLPAQFTYGASSSAAQPHSLPSLARQQPTLKSSAPRAASITVEGRVAAPVAQHVAVAITPRQPVLSAKAEQKAVAAPALHHKFIRTAEDGAAQAGAAPQAALPSSGSAAVVAAEDAWFTAQATPVPPPMEQSDNAGGMKLSYKFLRWGGGQVDISAQPNQLLFQASTEIVRDRLGESLLARPQGQAWQMDEQPERRQPQQHHQNDEEEC